MKTKFFLVAAALLASVTMMAAIGPQSVKVTFNGSDSEGWTTTSTSASIGTTADGVVNVQMALQSNDKYRADFQYNTAGFTMDKSKDVVWAIKLTGALPGTSNSSKFEINCEKGGDDKWVNDINSPAGTFTCADGGIIYYFNPSTQSSADWADVNEGTTVINNIHFIFADAVIANAEDAHYAVDWIASFSSVNALADFKDWNDEAQDATASLPYLELGFLLKADGTSYDICKNGFVDVELEGNYKVKLFAIEYFLIEDFSKAKQYTLKLETTGGGGVDAIAVWDFPYQITSNDDAAALNTKAAAVTGVVPGSGDVTSAIDPIASSTCEANFWTLALPGSQLTPLATIGGKTLVGLFVTSQNLIEAKSAKFASAANAEKAKPELTQTGMDPSVIILNSTQQKVETSLAEAVENANDGDLISLYGDVAISGSRLEITKELTIQGATGSETITCEVAANSIMVLANGEGAEHTVTFKNLVIDGRNTERSIQLFDANKATLCMEDVNIVNTQYTGKIADIKSNINPLILKGNNSFATGVALNRYKFIKHEGATHTSDHPIHLILANDYDDNCKVVEGCNTPALYTAEDAKAEKTWTLVPDGSNLKTHRTGAITYDLEVKAAAEGKSTLVLGFDAPLPNGVKAYRLELHNEEIYAYEESSIQARKPVLIVAATGHYTFTSAEDATLDESTATEARYGDLIGNFQLSNKKVPACGDGVYNYILTKKDNVVGFFQVGDANNAIAKNRAYLSCNYDVNESVTPGAPERSMRIVFQESTTTNIDNATLDAKSEKVLINGTIYIRKAEHLYRIDGQLVK